MVIGADAGHLEFGHDFEAGHLEVCGNRRARSASQHGIMGQ